MYSHEGKFSRQRGAQKRTSWSQSDINTQTNGENLESREAILGTWFFGKILTRHVIT